IEGCHNLAQMINGLLQFSSITKNLPPVNKIDLNKLIPNILEDINHSINTSEVKINVNANLPTVLAHESLLKQVFLNLITNSIKYKKENKEVTIEIGYKDTNYNFVELFVKDDGIGIPTEFQGKIFDLFKKFHASTNIEGNGVGLGTCKKIINFYNGKIWVESENQKGTIIYFTLQVA
nr:hypothetical protein [Ferruginibacter sp.]